MSTTSPIRLKLENYSSWQQPFEALKVIFQILSSIRKKQFGLPLSIHLRDSNGSLLGISAKEICYPIYESARLSELKNLICKIEDVRFFQHKGIDWKGLIRAATVNLREAKLKQGGSTITQQLARNIFLSPHKSITRKICEAVIALKLERSLSKDEILTAYCNSVYLGHGLRGFEAASRFIFRRSLHQLESHQLAGLVGLLCSPNRFYPLKNIEVFSQRKKQLAARLSIEDIPTHINPISQQLFRIPRIEKQIISTLNIMGLSDIDVQAVETTINRKLQRDIDREIKIVSLGNNISNVAVVVICNHTGNVLAESSWSNGTETAFSPTFDGKIQPGSTFKPFAVISALEQGVSLDTKIKSAPFSTTFQLKENQGVKWSVRNYRDQYFGPSSIQSALVNSDNSVFARLALSLDQAALSETYRKFNLISEGQFTPSTVLGGIRNGISLLSIAAAYSAIARNGVYIPPRLFKFIQFRDGTFSYLPTPSNLNILAPSVCAQINRLLQQSGVVLSSGIFAGKSGTTKAGSLFAGYDKNVSLAVWVNFKETPDEHDDKAITAKNTIEKIADAILGYRHSRLLEII